MNKKSLDFLGIDLSIFKMQKKELIKRVVLAFLGVFSIGFGIAFNTSAGYGNDPITVFFDGLRKILNVDFGIATNIANWSLFLVILVFARRYINIGTFVYLLLGNTINLGFKFYGLLNIPSNFAGRVFSSLIGCFLLFFGIALYVAINIGVDSWTGLVLLLKDKFKKEYKFFKVLIDLVALALGYILGGKVGAVTLTAAVLGGPIIQRMLPFIKNKLLKENTFSQK